MSAEKKVNHEHFWEKQPRDLKPTCASVALLTVTGEGRAAGRGGAHGHFLAALLARDERAG